MSRTQRGDTNVPLPAGTPATGFVEAITSDRTNSTATENTVDPTVHPISCLVADRSAGGGRILPGESDPFAAITVEVQLSKDENKPYSWLLYHAGQHYRLRVPSYLLVITNDPEVAAWAAGPFRSGMVTMRPLVISAAHFPPMTDPEEAKRSLERAFLSGLVHASEPVAADIGRALATALDASPDDAGLHYGTPCSPCSATRSGACSKCR